MELDLRCRFDTLIGHERGQPIQTIANGGHASDNTSENQENK